MERIETRREFIHRYFLLVSAFIGGTVVAGGCNDSGKPGDKKKSNAPKPVSCSDMNGVSEAELEKRKKMGYVENSPIADNICSNCKLYLSPADGVNCGGCQLFKGPVTDNGYCAYYAPLIS